MTTPENQSQQMDASSQIVGGAPTKPTWDKKGKRNLMIIGGIIITAALFMTLMFAGGKKEVQKPSMIPEANNTYQPGALSDEDRSAIAREEQQRLEMAKGQGQSAFQQPADGHTIEETPTPQRQPTTTSGNVPMSGQIGGGSQQPTQPVKPQIDEDKLKALEKQMAAQMLAWGMTPAEGNQNDGRTYIREFKKQGDNNQSTANGQQESGDQSPRKKGRVIARALEEIHSGSLIGSFDTDAPGTIRVRLADGPLQGAVLRGKGQMLGDGVQVTFNECSYNGVKFKCEAMALDEQTSSDIVEGRYNGRYAQRFVFPVLTEGIKAFAGARAQTGTSVVVIPAGGVAQEIPAPSAEQARNAMIAAGADQTGKALAGVRKDPQVILDMGKTVGVMFIEPVFESDINGTNGNGK